MHEIKSTRPKELGRWLRTLREGKNWTQEALAKRLGIERSTVSAWENGTYIPSADILNKLGNELDSHQSLDVWREAGIHTEKLLAHFETDRFLLGVDVPLIQAAPVRENDTEVGTIRVPASLVRDPEHTACVRIQGHQVSEGKFIDFFPFATNDIAVIDKSEIDGRRLSGQLIAVLFDPFPNLLGIPQSVRVPRGTVADPRRLKLLGKMYGVTEEDRHNADSFIPKQPSIQLGWLRFERENEGAELPVDGEAWRLLLEGAVVSGVGSGYSIPLTEWQAKSRWWKEDGPHAADLIKGRTILGRVTCWMRGTDIWKGEQRATDEIKGPKTQRGRRK